MTADYGALDHDAFEAALYALMTYYHTALAEKDATIARLNHQIAELTRAASPNGGKEAL